MLYGVSGGSGEIFDIEHVCVCVHVRVCVCVCVRVRVLEMQQYIDISPYRDTLGSDTVSIHI